MRLNAFMGEAKHAHTRGDTHESPVMNQKMARNGGYFAHSVTCVA
jgi:hypothetical protein